MPTLQRHAKAALSPIVFCSSGGTGMFLKCIAFDQDRSQIEGVCPETKLNSRSSHIHLAHMFNAISSRVIKFIVDLRVSNFK